MFRFRTLVGLLCVAVLVTRVAGVHLHLCFDGSELPASVHLTEDAYQERAGVSGVHEDVDVSLLSVAVGQKPGSSIELPALIAATLVLFSVPFVGSAPLPRGRVQLLIPSPIFRFQPPLRGPPF
ncbi:MAG: hypothetical protein ABI640_18190 [Gammaproteobacteria bacterium]